MDDRIGQQLGSYRLLRLLGQGGFADVYLGEHIHLRTQAAIKILQVRLVEHNIQSFLEEARTIAHLVHPYIIRVLDFGVEANIPFLVTDYAPQGTFRQRFLHGKPLPPTPLFPYIKQAASALQYAHDKKLIHRDVKPENMLLGPNEEVLLSDFGLALIQTSITRSTTETAGTAAYMAPEQLQGRPVPASDQYSLGIVAYEWLTGSCPFQGTFFEIASQHMLASPAPLHEKNPTIAPEIEQAVMRALAKNVEQRFPSVHEFATALERACLASRAISVSQPLMPPPFLASTSTESSSALSPESSTPSDYFPIPSSGLSMSSMPSMPATTLNNINAWNHHIGNAEQQEQVPLSGELMTSQGQQATITPQKTTIDKSIPWSENERKPLTEQPSSQAFLAGLSSSIAATNVWKNTSEQSSQSLPHFSSERMPAAAFKVQDQTSLSELPPLNPPTMFANRNPSGMKRPSSGIGNSNQNTPVAVERPPSLNADLASNRSIYPSTDKDYPVTGFTAKPDRASGPFSSSYIPTPFSSVNKSKDLPSGLTRPAQVSTPVRRSPSQVSTLFFVIMILFIIIGGAGLIYLNNNHPVQGNPKTGVTSSNDQPTRTTTGAQKTATDVAASPTSQSNANPYSQATGTVLVMNDSLASNNPQVQWQEEPPTVGTCLFNQGHYVAAAGSGYFTMCYARATNYANFTYQLEMMFGRQDDQISGGLVIRGTSAQQFYFYEVYNTGAYAFWRCENLNQCLLLSGGKTGKPLTSFKSGINQPNTLAISANNNTFMLYMNSVPVTTVPVTDVQTPAISHGMIGVMARGGTTPGVVNATVYSNLKIWN